MSKLTAAEALALAKISRPNKEALDNELETIVGQIKSAASRGLYQLTLKISLPVSVTDEDLTEGLTELGYWVKVRYDTPGVYKVYVKWDAESLGKVKPQP